MSKRMKPTIMILLAAALLIPSSWLAPDARAAAPIPEAGTVTVYHETFEDGRGVATRAEAAVILFRFWNLF
ncbi:hypothetical protein [Paenibacillus sp. A14]|uniref:hypothetical protein n=1 Tax=Paenibacillus sp. A14 TaxID=3119820 RepID=UPI002FDFFBE0